MKAAIDRTNRLLNSPLRTGPRGLLLLATIVLVGAFFVPLWRVTTFGPEGLRVGSYGYELSGSEVRGGGPDPASEVAGLREVPSDFDEFRWLPLALGAVGLLFLRAAVLGTIGMLVDVSVVFAYLTGFSLWSIGSRFARYGEAHPDVGAYVLAIVAMILAAAIGLSWQQARSEIAGETRIVG